MRTPHRFLGDIMHPEANNFGAIRLAMALAVLVSHSYWLATGQPALEPLHAWTGHSLGEHAVQVFFFLSGVVVTQSLMTSGSLLDFAAARALRIFPALIVCAVLTALLVGPLVTAVPIRDYLTSAGLPAYLARTISLSTGSAPLPGVFADTPVPNLVNLSLWTLKYEVLCYALLALFGWAYLARPTWRPALTAGLALVVAGIFVSEPKPVAGYTTADNLRYFILFFASGSLAYLLRHRLVLSWMLFPALAALFVIGIGTRFAELTSALFLGYGTLLAAALPASGLRRFTNRQDYSYGVYILACPIQQALIHALPGIGPQALSGLALAIVLPLAVLSWTCIERPVMQRRRRVVARIASFGQQPAQPGLPDRSGPTPAA